MFIEIELYMKVSGVEVSVTALAAWSGATLPATMALGILDTLMGQTAYLLTHWEINMKESSITIWLMVEETTPTLMELHITESGFSISSTGQVLKNGLKLTVHILDISEMV